MSRSPTAHAELGSLVTIVGGGTPSKARPEFFAGDIPWVTPKDMKVWTILDSEDHISQAAVDASAAKVVPAGSVLVVVRSGVLKHSLPVAIAGRAVTLNQDMKALVSGEHLESRFLAYFLKSSAPRLLTTVRGTTADNIPLDELRALRVPVLPLVEQRRIADILDRADSIRRKRAEFIALTQALQQSAFLEMFGDPVTNPMEWPVRPLGEVADVAGGLQVTSARSSNPISLPYLRVANVYRERLELSEVKEILVTSSERDRALLRVGDVLVVEGHGNPEELGRSAVWGGEIPVCTHQNHLIRVRVDSRFLRPEFLSAFLNSSAGRAQMLRLGKTTSGLNTISTNNVRGVSLLVPPLSVQDRFVRVVTGVRGLTSRVQGQRHDEELFQSLLARAFSGRLHAEDEC